MTEYKKRIYLDYNSTSPMLPGVFEAMKPFLKEIFGNPSSIHQEGRNAKNAIEKARENISDLVGVDSRNIIFTSGASESINTAIKGIVLAKENNRKTLIASAVEHSSTREICQYLEDEFSFKIKVISVGTEGIIDLEDLKRILVKRACLLTCIHAQNETGAIQPVQEIIQLAKERSVITHIDGAQAVGKIDVDLKRLEPDLYSFSSHKMGGPKGVGALYVKNGIYLRPIIHGGHQEINRRGGTENVAAIVGFGEAARILIKERSRNEQRIKRLRMRLYKGIVDSIQRIELNGSLEKSLPNTLDLRFKGVDGMSLMMNLDIKGIAVSTGSACLSGASGPSPALLAMGRTEMEAKESVRLSLGWNNYEEEIDLTVKTIRDIVNRLRRSQN